MTRGLNDGHFEAFVEVLNDTLKELSVPDDLISEVMAVAEGSRSQVLNR